MSSVVQGPAGPLDASTWPRSATSRPFRRLRALAVLLVGALVVVGVWTVAYALPAAVVGAVTASQPTWDCEGTGTGGPSEEPDEFEVGLPTAARIAPGAGCTFTMEVTNTAPVTVTLRSVEDGFGGPGRSGVVPSFDWVSVDGGPQIAGSPGWLGVPPDGFTPPEEVLEAHAPVDAVIGPDETVVLRVHKTGGERPVDDCMRHGHGLSVLVTAGPVSGRDELLTATQEPVLLRIGPTAEEGCA